MVGYNSLTDFGVSFIVWRCKDIFHRWGVRDKYSTNDCCCNTDNNCQLLQNKGKNAKEKGLRKIKDE